MNAPIKITYAAAPKLNGDRPLVTVTLTHWRTRETKEGKIICGMQKIRGALVPRSIPEDDIVDKRVQGIPTSTAITKANRDNRPHAIKIIPDNKGGYKARYYIGGFMLLTKRHADAGNAAHEAATAIQTDSPLATVTVEDNEIWQIDLK